MEIKIKGNNNVTFGTLLVGELFVFADMVWMKTYAGSAMCTGTFERKKLGVARKFDYNQNIYKVKKIEVTI